MNKILCLAVATLPLTTLCLSLASAATLDENARRITLTCRGNDVTINGNRNMVVLRGTCRKLTIAGNGNMVTVGAVSSIETPGNRNTVVWSSAKTPRVTNLGNGNLVTKAKPRKR